MGFLYTQFVSTTMGDQLVQVTESTRRTSRHIDTAIFQVVFAGSRGREAQHFEVLFPAI